MSNGWIKFIYIVMLIFCGIYPSIYGHLDIWMKLAIGFTYGMILGHFFFSTMEQKFGKSSEEKKLDNAMWKLAPEVLKALKLLQRENEQLRNEIVAQKKEK